MSPVDLSDLAEDFALAIKRADEKEPVAHNKRSGKPFQPGIGPHSESETLELVGEELDDLAPARYGDRWHLDVPYPSDGRRKCDICIGSGKDWQWSIEAKMLRFLGDNGRVNDNILMHILSPYPADRSALTDCDKLLESELTGRKAILIFGYDHQEWPLDPAIEAFELLAEDRVELGPRHVGRFQDLVHPVHGEGRVFVWEIGKQ